MGPIGKTLVQPIGIICGYCWLQTAGSKQLIIGCNFSQIDAILEQETCDIQLLRRGLLVLKGADVGETHTPRIIAMHMGTHNIPATTHIDISIATNQKIESNIIAMLRLNVEGLQETHPENALRLCAAVFRICGQQYDHGHGQGEIGELFQRGLRQPHGAGYISQYQTTANVVLICKVNLK